MIPKPVAVSWSGGKDSALALSSLLADVRYRPVALFTAVTKEYDRISIHGVRRALLEAQAAALGLPLFTALLDAGTSNAGYVAAFAKGLQGLHLVFPEVRTIAFGDLFLADVRTYRETHLDTLGLGALFPLWGQPTDRLAAQFIDAGFHARLACVDTSMLHASFVGRSFDKSLLSDLPAGVDPCGERGEFHTFVTAGPVFQHPIPHVKGTQVRREDRFEFQDFDVYEVGAETPNSQCPTCGLGFSCGVSSQSCWCAQRPRVMRVPIDQGQTRCLCPDCLRRA